MLDTVCLSLLALDIPQGGQPLQMKLGPVNGGINRRLNWRGDERDGVFILLDKTLSPLLADRLILTAAL